MILFVEIIQRFIKAASRSMGAMLTFVVAMTFYKYGFRYVVLAASIFPLIGSIGLAFSSESPIFQERSNI